MTTIQPTSALARLAGLSTRVGSGVVEQAPPEVARLASGAIVDGTVVGRDRAGLTLIETVHGMVALKTGVILPDGATIKLELQSQGNQIRAVILTIDQAATDNRAAAGITTEPDPAQRSTPATTSTVSGQATSSSVRQDILPSSAGPLLAAGTVVTARLLPAGDASSPSGTLAGGATVQARAADGAAAATPSSSAPVGPGGTLTLRIIGIEQPRSGGLTAGSSIPAKGPATALQQTAGQNQSSASRLPSPLSMAPMPTNVPAAVRPSSATRGGPSPAGTGPLSITTNVPAGVRPSSATPGGQSPVGTGPPPITTNVPAGGRPSSATPDRQSLAVTGPLPSTLSAQAAASQTQTVAGHPPKVAVGTAAAGVPGSATASGEPAGLPADHLTPRGVGQGKGPSTAPVTHTGTIVGQFGTGQVILATPLGRLLVLTASTLAPNTRLHFHVMEGAEPLVSQATGYSTGPSGMGLAQDWPALRELIASFGMARGQSTPQVVDTFLPQPGPRLAHGILFFMTALALGNVGQWLGAGSTAAFRARGQAELLGRLGDDFQQLARMVSDGAQGDWKTYLVPLWDGESLRQLRFFHRRHGGENDDDSGQRGDRFLIDLDLSRLGAVQIDGLLLTSRFNLIVRSRTPLDHGARRGIEEIFRDGCACAGLAGGVSFAGHGEFVPLPFATSGPGAALMQA